MTALSKGETRPFVDRDAELALLREALALAKDHSEPHFVFVEGEFGVGKTVFVEHFLHEVEVEDSDVLVGQGRCSLETEMNGLVPFAQVLQALLQPSGRAARIVTDALEFAREVAPAWLDVVTGGITGASIKTVKEGQKLLGKGTFSQENLFVQYTNALVRLAQKRRLLIFIDDLQWADASSLSMLFHLSRNLPAVPVLLICAHRPLIETGNRDLFRKIHSNARRYGALRIMLSEGIDVWTYANLRYPRNRFSHQILASIQARTEGYPLFVDNLFSLWQKNGVIRTEEDENGTEVYAFADEQNVQTALPESIGEVLDARIDLLGNELREILTCASVEGEDFTAQVLMCLRRLDEQCLAESLEILEDDFRLVREAGSRSIGTSILDFYRFMHRFYREHVYENLSALRRRTLHRQVGKCLEDLYPNRIQVAGQLAMHFREAYELEKAASYAHLAALNEQARYAWEVGEQWCQFGLTIVQELSSEPAPDDLRLSFLETSGHGHLVSAHYQAAIDRYTAARALAVRRQASLARQARILDALVSAMELAGQYTAVSEQLREAGTLLASTGAADLEFEMVLQLHRGLLEIRTGNTAVAAEMLAKTVDGLSSINGDGWVRRQTARAYNWYGVALNQSGVYRPSFQAFKEAIDIVRAMGDLNYASTFILNLADSLLAFGALDECERTTKEGEAVARQVGEMDDVAYAAIIAGTTQIERGDPKKAIELLRYALDSSVANGSYWNFAYINSSLARAYLSLGDRANAETHASAGCIGASEYDRGIGLTVKAEVSATFGEWEQASQAFQEAIECHRIRGHEHHVARAKLAYGRALLARNNVANGRPLVSSALETFQRLGATRDVQAALTLLG